MFFKKFNLGQTTHVKVLAKKTAETSIQPWENEMENGGNCLDFSQNFKGQYRAYIWILGDNNP